MQAWLLVFESMTEGMPNVSFGILARAVEDINYTFFMSYLDSGEYCVKCYNVTDC